MKKPARRPVFFLQPPKRFQVRKNAITWQPEPEQQPGRPEQQPELLFCHRR
jgi:hypothetical protein